ASERRAVAEVVVIDLVIVPLLRVHLDLKGRVAGCLLREIAVIDALLRPEQMKEELVVLPADNRTICHAAVVTIDDNPVVITAGMIEKDALKNQMRSFQRDGRFAGENHLAWSLCAQRNWLVFGALRIKPDVLI